MVYLAEYLWGWLLGAGLIGLAMGWVGVVHRAPGLSRSALRWSVFLYAVTIGVALSRIVPGRFGYGLDLAVVMLLPYLGGCTIGSWLRGLVISRSFAPRHPAEEKP